MAAPNVRIIGIPMDLGQKRRGVDMGPSAIRAAGLQDRLARLGYEVHDCGNVEAPQMEQVDHPFHENKAIGKAHHLPQVAETCRRIYDLATSCVAADDYAVFLGGDHSLSIGTLSAVTATQEVGVLWVDAHGDINTPHTTPSGNIHGMVVASLLGDGPAGLTDIGRPGPKIKPSQLVYIGLRDLDLPERARLAHSDSLVFTMREVDEHGVASLTRQILGRFAPYSHIHVSLDMDALDPSVAPGVGTPVPGGLSFREAHLLMEILADSGKARSIDVVEVNPILDHGNTTAEIAASLVGSLFGQRIL